MPHTQHPTPRQLADALLRLDGAEALELAQAYLEARGLGPLFDELARAALADVGERWRQHHISSADEHAATALAQEVLDSLPLPRPFWAGGPRAVLACVAGEQHALGVRLVGRLLALDGWRVVLLGADTPSAALGGLVARVQPRFVGLSVSVPGHLPAARRAIHAVHRSAPGVPVLLGGTVLTLPGTPADHLGADALARSAQQAVQWARTLAAAQPSQPFPAAP